MVPAALVYPAAPLPPPPRPRAGQITDSPDAATAWRLTSNRGGTWVLRDGRDGAVSARSTPGARPLLTGFEILDRAGATWQVSPDRKVMPSRWRVSDPEGRTRCSVARRSLVRLANPLARSAIVLLDADDVEAFRLVDPRDSALERLMISTTDLLLLAGDEPVARLGHLKREPDGRTGLRAKLARLIQGSDRALISFGDEHVLPAPVALTLIMVDDRLNDQSGG